MRFRARGRLSGPFLGPRRRVSWPLRHDRRHGRDPGTRPEVPEGSGDRWRTVRLGGGQGAHGPGRLDLKLYLEDIYIYIPRTHLTPILEGTYHIINLKYRC